MKTAQTVLYWVTIHQNLESPAQQRCRAAGGRSIDEVDASETPEPSGACPGFDEKEQPVRPG